jgi:hypothetical protein
LISGRSKGGVAVKRLDSTHSAGFKYS